MVKITVLLFFIANAIFMWLSVDNAALPIPVFFVVFL